MQESIAIFAIASLHKRPKQLWQIVAGQGKSRIIATAGLHALAETKTSDVHFVFPSKHLMERDKKLFEPWLYMTDFEGSAHYHSDLDFEPKKNSIIIIDEIDYFIYGDTGDFYSF